MEQFSYKDLNVVYEDNHVIVVVKPQNIPSCPDETGDKDMQTIVKEYLIDKYQKPGDAFVGLVHRLDRPDRGQADCRAKRGPSGAAGRRVEPR